MPNEPFQPNNDVVASPTLHDDNKQNIISMLGFKNTAVKPEILVRVNDLRQATEASVSAINASNRQLIDILPPSQGLNILDIVRKISEVGKNSTVGASLELTEWTVELYEKAGVGIHEFGDVYPLFQSDLQAVSDAIIDIFSQQKPNVYKKPAIDSLLFPDTYMIGEPARISTPNMELVLSVQYVNRPEANKLEIVFSPFPQNQ